MLKRRIVKDFFTSYAFRTVLFSLFSFFMSIFYGSYNIYVAIVNQSVWYALLATYYILLVFTRGGVLIHHRRKKKVSNVERDEIETYMICGVFIIIFDIFLTFPIAQNIFSDKFLRYTGIVFYISFAYSAYKIAMSVLNLRKASKQDNLIVKSLRNINFADAMASVFSLQTAFLQTFFSDKDTSLINMMTGFTVVILTFSLGLYMIVKGKVKLKSI